MISRATIGKAYKDLLLRGRIHRHRGAKMVVCPLDWPFDSPGADLDDLIDATILKARERGYTLQDLRKRVRDRLLIEPPDHILIVEEEQEMRQLLRQEVSKMLRLTIDVTSPAQIAANQGPVIGALVVCLPKRVLHIASLLERGRPLLAIKTVYHRWPCGSDSQNWRKHP